MQFPRLWTDHCPQLLTAFNSIDMDYLLIGSMAKSHYSEQKWVDDLDLMISCTPDNASAVRRVILRLGENMTNETAKKLVESDIRMSLFGNKAVAPLGYGKGSVDILTPPKDFDFGRAFSRSTAGLVPRYEIPVHIASVRDLELLDLLRARREHLQVDR